MEKQSDAKRPDLVNVGDITKKELYPIVSKVATCTNIDAFTAAYNPEHSRACLAAAESVARQGMAGHLSAFLLSIRQVAFTNPQKEDNRAAFAQYISEAATSAKPDTTVQLFCRPQAESKPGDAPCHGTTVSKEEILIALGATFSRQATPDMNPRRNIPVTKPLAALNGFFDAIMTPENFLAQRADGTDMSLAETVAAFQKNHSPAKSRDAMLKCIENNTKDSLKTCTVEAARVGLAMRLQEGLDYEGSTFRGVKKSALAPAK